MADFQLVMPKMGESIMEATILKWLKKEGDDVEIDDTILEIATDKVDSEIPSPVAGKIAQVFFKEDDSVPVGTTIAVIKITGEVENDIVIPPVEMDPPSLPKKSSDNGKEAKFIEGGKKLPPVANGRFYSPLVRKIATEEGVTLAQLHTIEGTGLQGRVTKRDILAYLQERDYGETAAQEMGHGEEQAAPQEMEKKTLTEIRTRSTSGGDEIIQMDRMRKMISEHMVSSKRTAAHVTSFVEADVTSIVTWRDNHKDHFLSHHNTKLTFTPIFIQAVAKAIIDFPKINASLIGEEILIKKDINIGMATALPSGNLIVPVIKNADNYNLIGLAKQVNNLADSARQNTLKPDDISGGTFTLTNVGIFGNVMGTPIINQPQSAILATGAIQKKPAVVETEYGDLIAIRHMMFLSLSYDHRIIDGFLGGSFLRKVADYLEQFGHEELV